MIRRDAARGTLDKADRPMGCVCLQRLQALLNSLTAMPPVAGLVPPLPPALMASLNVALAPPGFPACVRRRPRRPRPMPR